MNGSMYDLPLPPEFVPPPEVSGPGSPVVTEGVAGSRQPYGDFFSAYERMQQLRQPQSSGGFFNMTPAQQSALDRLGALGAAMASTRSPTFAGALGEGLQALQRTAAGQRQEERQNRQADIEAAYRAASEARQLREILNREDPNSLQGQELMARIRQLNEQANYYARRPSGEGSGGRDRVVGRERGNDGNMYLIYESGRVVRAGGEDSVTFQDPANSLVGRRYLTWETARRQFDTQLAADRMLPPAMREQLRREWLRNNPEPPNPFTRYEAAQAGQPGQPQTAPAETAAPNVQRRQF